MSCVWFIYRYTADLAKEMQKKTAHMNLIRFSILVTVVHLVTGNTLIVILMK